MVASNDKPEDGKTEEEKYKELVMIARHNAKLKSLKLLEEAECWLVVCYKEESSGHVYLASEEPEQLTELVAAMAGRMGHDYQLLQIVQSALQLLPLMISEDLSVAETIEKIQRELKASKTGGIITPPNFFPGQGGE